MGEEIIIIKKILYQYEHRIKNLEDRMNRQFDEILEMKLKAKYGHFHLRQCGPETFLRWPTISYLQAEGLSIQENIFKIDGELYEVWARTPEVK